MKLKLSITRQTVETYSLDVENYEMAHRAAQMIRNEIEYEQRIQFLGRDEETIVCVHDENGNDITGEVQP